MSATASNARRDQAVRRARGPRTGADESPLTAHDIVAAGVRLTAARGLAGWSTRDLAAEVGCWPTAIVHRVGARHDVELAVVDAIVRQISLPAPDLTWRPWFTAVLDALRVTLTAHPGVARWLGIAAPLVPSVITLIDTGVAKLADAGLGDEAPAAHITLLNTAVHLIAAEDERDADPKLLASLGESLVALRDSPDHPGAARMAAALTGGFHRDEIYRYCVDRALDGVATRIAAVGSFPGRADGPEPPVRA
ncbi:TetR/AcrR family transcriptional regulator [Nocardia puris]|uniref:TetR family transcriptional regulator n=2 Tax=Nocardia puris TaxID=208602 RepID=A0A366E1S3_9NOCA|nr:TetR/AcrR family transcriptional regulator [Nocardia puris]MBF6209651.1 TetR/AcrR family transcriptional regulator [Nocardia puris]MBF6366223.1 TetR/AcrR family transcriptional regulator [Nocardia puris]MBF6458438.1 TetR/AcrR family transcriptional regulator [Nocardia puris]RBO96085.1 TetR family transcriptional regulator [Nocardia puris]